MLGRPFVSGLVRGCTHRTNALSLTAAASIRCSSYSRMLDMGGSPTGMHDKSKNIIKNASKNCKVQAVCFDFDALTRGVESESSKSLSSNSTAETTPNNTAQLGDVQPETSVIQQMAAMLNVSLGASKHDKNAKASSFEDDDLSLLTGDTTATKTTPPQKTLPKNPDWNKDDVRFKYAAKLKQRGTGFAGIERAKAEVEEGLSGGDAAGHLAARKIVLSGSGNAGNHWMAGTGTGNLLQYLTQRSMKIALLPRPSDEEEKVKEQTQKMHDLERQLMDVEFTLLQTKTSTDTSIILSSVLKELGDDPINILLVSDRDDYIRAAKDAGMVTCRIRPPNARRGNVSAHYMAESVPKVKDIIDEINGISFKAVLSQ